MSNENGSDQPPDTEPSPPIVPPPVDEKEVRKRLLQADFELGQQPIRSITGLDK